jgi:hypothetical protein
MCKKFPFLETVIEVYLKLRSSLYSTLKSRKFDSDVLRINKDFEFQTCLVYASSCRWLRSCWNWRAIQQLQLSPPICVILTRWTVFWFAPRRILFGKARPKLIEQKDVFLAWVWCNSLSCKSVIVVARKFAAHSQQTAELAETGHSRSN